MPTSSTETQQLAGFAGRVEGIKVFEDFDSGERSSMSWDGSDDDGGRGTGHEPSERFVREAMPHSDYLLRHARHLTKRGADAEDLLQDTMLKAYLAFGNFRAGTNLRAWLYRIMMNTWIDRHRSIQRRPMEQLSEDITDAQLLHHASHARAGLRSAEAEVLGSVLGSAGRALRTLPRDLRTTIYYADVEGYRNTEIAEMLDIPVGTVASRLRRGRIRLREILTDPAEERCAC